MAEETYRVRPESASSSTVVERRPITPGPADAVDEQMGQRVGVDDSASTDAAMLATRYTRC
jgi:hypothetical protein